MELDQIEEKIREFIESEFPNPGEKLENTTNLLEDWFVDSFGIINTLMFLENAFGVNVDRADITPGNFKSVHTLSLLVQGRLSNLK
jgi:acyl carrier protein